MPALTLSKYHGLGNDFLVLVDPDGTVGLERGDVAALCERHRGVGADGVLRLSAPAGGGDLRMELRNADGGAAETSGNGLRCAVLAAAHAGLLPAGAFDGSTVTVETGAGPVAARLLGAGRPGALASVAVAMGAATVDPDPPSLPPSLVDGVAARRVDVGNPHLVLLVDDLAAVDLGLVGPALEASVPGGCNVEVVRPLPGDGGLQMKVWERGVGLTEACGSGSCAAAATARLLGRAGERVVVANPGGELLVELAGSPSRPSVTLTGPACRIGTVSVALDDLRLVGRLPA